MHYPVGPIATKHWQPIIFKRLADAKKTFSKPLLAELCDRTQGQPFYTQQLCHVLWSLIEPGGEVIADRIDQAVAELLRRESHAYVTLRESLTKNEQRLLGGLADRATPPQPFSSDFTRQYGLRSACNAQSAAASLVAKDLIEREGSPDVINDRF